MSSFNRRESDGLDRAAHLLVNLAERASNDAPHASVLQNQPAAVSEHKENIPDASGNAEEQVLALHHILAARINFGSAQLHQTSSALRVSRLIIICVQPFHSIDWGLQVLEAPLLPEPPSNPSVLRKACQVWQLLRSCFKKGFVDVPESLLRWPLAPCY